MKTHNVVTRGSAQTIFSRVFTVFACLVVFCLLAYAQQAEAQACLGKQVCSNPIGCEQEGHKSYCQPGYGCQSGNGSAPTDDQCQWLLDQSGDVNGSMPAPEPSEGQITVGGVSLLCDLQQCSQGIRQNAGVTNVLYWTNATGYENLCHFVDNTSKTENLFVPQGSAKEFSDFIQNAPKYIVFGYCTLGYIATGQEWPAPPAPGYISTATYPTGFYLNGDPPSGGAPNLPNPATYVTNSPTGGTYFTDLPTTRVSGYPVTSPPQSATLPPYTRYDCEKGVVPPNPSQCNTRTLVETRGVTISTVANPNPACANLQDVTDNCNGSWQAADGVTTSCLIDGIQYANCLDDFSPPSKLGCTMPNGKKLGNGDTGDYVIACLPVFGQCIPDGQNESPPTGYVLASYAPHSHWGRPDFEPASYMMCPVSFENMEFEFQCNNGTLTLISGPTDEGSKGCPPACEILPQNTCGNNL